MGHVGLQRAPRLHPVKSVIEIAGFSWMTIGVHGLSGMIWAVKRIHDVHGNRLHHSQPAAYHLINEHVNPIARIQKGD